MNIQESYAIRILTEILKSIIVDTIGNRREVFNIELLIRQNLLTILETDEYMEKIFGQPYVCFQDKEGHYLSKNRLIDKIISKVMRILKLKDKNLKDEWIN